jgi:hypothetical protein
VGGGWTKYLFDGGLPWLLNHVVVVATRELAFALGVEIDFMGPYLLKPDIDVFPVHLSNCLATRPMICQFRSGVFTFNIHK